MITVRTVCFVCFVLLLETAHAKMKNISTITETTQVGTKATNNIKTRQNESTPILNTLKTPIEASKTPTKASKTPTERSKTNNPKNPLTNVTCGAQSTTKQTDGHCILSLPQDTLPLVIVALAVACFTLLMTSLICACQVCHLKAIIYRFKSPHHRNVDLHSIRKRSESPCRDDGQVEAQPTETCLMLSEVTTAQEVKNEESVQPSTEPLVDPNGDIPQEKGNSGGVESKEPKVENKEPKVGVESKEPDAGAPENTGV